ncbi:MAG: hypothetical protein A2014_09900 [Spirochaetes bacterium GWF1_49_6]|nr:MAG: hypothetical protein A2014_09900 [Spirochaetes bacterium GWF1_49_6]
MKKFIFLTIISITFAAGCSAPEDLTEKARDLGVFLCEGSFTNTLSELISNKNIPLLVEIDTNIISELYKYSQEFWQDYTVNAYEGDNEHGDGSATHYLILKSKDREIMDIRLRYDTSLKKFYILNFTSYLDY